ncbi:hypothetical protein FACS1894169_06360 [Bacteroidia bacterium]|nr:hypothetical protein FACS1894169_06360 [Bacteroidia bacterium]
MDVVAKANNTVAIISAGWDPGTNSIVRSMMEFMTPRGVTYTAQVLVASARATLKQRPGAYDDRDSCDRFYLR